MDARDTRPDSQVGRREEGPTRLSTAEGRPPSGALVEFPPIHHEPFRRPEARAANQRDGFPSVVYSHPSTWPPMYMRIRVESTRGRWSFYPLFSEAVSAGGREYSLVRVLPGFDPTK